MLQHLVSDGLLPYCSVLPGASGKGCAQVSRRRSVVSLLFDSISEIKAKPFLFSGYSGLNQKECVGRGCCWEQAAVKVSLIACKRTE